jgi:hypothetical protein
MKKFIIMALITSMCGGHTHTTANTPMDTIQSIEGIVSGMDNEYVYFQKIDGTGWVIDLEAGYCIGDMTNI